MSASRQAAVAMAALLITVACSSEPKAPARPAPGPSESISAELPPASLPDLSQMEPSVQQQLRERDRALRAILDNHPTSSDVAHAYGEVANLLLAAESFEAAEPYYRHAQALEPGEMRWPYYLGHVYMATGAPDKASAAFERALRLRPSDVATLVWLGRVHLDQGNPDEAEPLFAQALSIQPRAVAALFGMGQAALAKRDYPRAANLFEQVLSADPRASIAHYPLALAYRAMGETAKADAHLRQRGNVEVGPPDPLMVELRGLLHGGAAEEERGSRALESGDYRAAAAHFRKAVELSPDDPSLRHKLGTALSLMGDNAGAIGQFEEIVRRSPAFSQAHYSLGVLMIAGGRYQDAIEQLSTAVRQEPGYVEARTELAEALARSGQLEKSMAQYQQVLAGDPNQADAQFGYAMTLVALQRYQQARDVLVAAATRHPDQPRFADALTRLEHAGR